MRTVSAQKRNKYLFILGTCITQHYPIKYFWVFLGTLNDFNWTNFLAANEFGQHYLTNSQHLHPTPPPLPFFFHFYGPETSVKSMMYSVVKPSSIEITNALQNLCLFHEVGNNMLELFKDENHCMCMTQQENNLAVWVILTENKIPITVKISIYFRTFLLVPWEFKVADVHCICFLKNFRTAFSQKTCSLKLLNLNLKNATK